MEDNKANRFRFRAWDSNRNIMLLPDIKDDAGLDEWYGGEWPIFNVILECVQKGGWTLMQSTGLVDKNGKEIFEGDVALTLRDEFYATVPQTKEKAIIYYDIYYASYMLKAVVNNGIHTFEEVGGFLRDEIGSSLEIIGNIYENGDLLK